MISLGFSIGHDKGAVIIKDGKILVGITEERITRIKSDGAYSFKLPRLSIEYCLEYTGLRFSDINRFVYTTTEFPDDYSEQFEELTGISSDRLEFIPHHLAHAYSTFFSSGFKESVVVVVDASGSVICPGSKLNKWYPKIDTTQLTEDSRIAESISIYHFTSNGYTETFKKWIDLGEETGSSSVGMMYGTGSLQLVYDESNNTWQAGKLMGLASYSDPDFVNRYPDVSEFTDGDVNISWNMISPEINYKSDFQSKANIAGVYQREQERLLLFLCDLAKKSTGSDSLCVAGGSFLNCNSNELIQKSDLFKSTYYVPCSDDSGIPLGCAWYGQDKKHGEFLSPYLGKTYSDGEILSILSKTNGINFKWVNDQELFDQVSDLVLENKVIGWMRDGGEIGPRALGNRSIVANPSCPWMVEYINSEIKHREWYRPFAPAVLYDHQQEIFDLDYFSPYMLLTTNVKNDWRKAIPAVTHYDGTSRVQSVSKEINPAFYGLISAFYRKSGIPILLNTSFNGKGEPMVETPEDAINTLLSTQLYAVVINNFIVTKYQ